MSPCGGYYAQSKWSLVCILLQVYGDIGINMANKHKHHIIPRHAGGSDDPSNLIELTIEEHAEAHRILYEEYNKIEDYCAWQGLTGLMKKPEIVTELQSAGGKRSAAQAYANGTHNFQINNASTYDHVKKLRSERMMGNTLGSIREMTDELRAKLVKGSQGNTNVRGYKWWTTGTTNRRSKECPSPEYKLGFTKKTI